MNNNAIVVLFTGLPRNFENFINHIKELNNNILIKKIIFSTWKNSLNYDQNQELNSLNVITILNETPSQTWEKSFYPQAHTLQSGIAACELTDIVLKSRSDVYIKPYFIHKMYELWSKKNLIETNTKIFNKKIWVNAFEITKPFYIDDCLYLGQAQDLIKLVTPWNVLNNKRWDIAMDGGGETHIRLFIHPFINNFPDLVSYQNRLIYGLPKSNSYLHRFHYKLNQFAKRNYKNLYIAPNSHDRFLLLKQRLREPEYLKFLAIYYHILNKYFLIYGDYDGITHKQIMCKKSRIFKQNSFESNFYIKTGPFNGIWCHDNQWIQNFIDQNFTCTLSKKIYDEMQMLSN